MSFNLHNRSLLDLKDYPPRAIRYLLNLAADSSAPRPRASSTSA